MGHGRHALGTAIRWGGILRSYDSAPYHVSVCCPFIASRTQFCSSQIHLQPQAQGSVEVEHVSVGDRPVRKFFVQPRVDAFSVHIFAPCSPSLIAYPASHTEKSPSLSGRTPSRHIHGWIEPPQADLVVVHRLSLRPDGRYMAWYSICHTKASLMSTNHRA